MNTTTSVAPRAGADERVREHAAELFEHDRWTRERLLEYQRDALRSLLAHAVEASSYYREALGPDAADGDVELSELPILTKATLMEEFDRVVTDPRLRLADVEAHVAGPGAEELFAGDYYVFATSGTTGRRGVFVYRRDEFERWVGACARIALRFGVGPETRLVAIGAPNPLHISKRVAAGVQAGRKGVPELTVVTPIAEMVEALNAYRPEVVITYASIAAELAAEQLDGRLSIQPAAVSVTSEVLTDGMRQRMRDAWGIEPAEVYAATEACPIAASMPGRRGLAIAEDLVVVEVVDEDNQPVPAGIPGHRVLLTNLVNRSQPLIRYELSDSVTLAADEPGIPYRLVARVDGRSEDALRLPGRGGEVAIHPYHVHAAFTASADVRQYQLVRVDGGVRARVVLASSARGDAVARIRDTLVRSLEAAGAAQPRVIVEPVAAIEREGGHAAKLKIVA